MALAGALEIGRGSVSIVADVTKFERAMTNVERRLNGVTGSLKIFAAAAAGAFALAKSGTVFAGLVENAMKFETALSKVRKTTGLSGESLDQFRRKVESIAQSMAGVELSKLTDIAVMGGRLGIPSDKIERFTRDVAMIGIALDDIPADEAVTSIGRILNVFNLGAENTIRFASALNKLDDTSTATGRDILDISRRLSGPAAVLGMSPQRVLALSAALKDAGVSNEVAGTAMSQVFARMAVEPQKFAVVAGVSVQRFSRMMQTDALVALQAFLRGLKQLRGDQQYHVLERMGFEGERVTTSLLQLSKVTGKLNGYVHTANQEWNTLNSILREAEIAGTTTKAQMTRMWNAIEILSIKIGDSLLPLVKALANSFTDLAIDAGKFWEAVKKDVTGRLAPVVKWAERISVLFKEWPRFLDYAWLHVTEKFDQLVEIGKRLGPQLWDNFKVGADNAITFVKNTFTQLGQFLGDLFTQVSANLRDRFTNAIIAVQNELPARLKTILGMGQGPKLPVRVHEIQPNVGLFAANKLQEGIKDLPGFPGLFANLPNNILDRHAAMMGIDRTVRSANAERAVREKANLPNPDEGKPAPRKTAKQRLEEANAKIRPVPQAARNIDFANLGKPRPIPAAEKARIAALGRHKQELSDDEKRIIANLGKQKPMGSGERARIAGLGVRAPGTKSFAASTATLHGVTERQSRSILDARARSAERRSRQKARRKAIHRQRLVSKHPTLKNLGAKVLRGTLTPEEAMGIFNAPEGGNRRGGRRGERGGGGRNIGSFWEQFDTLMGGDAEPSQRPKTRSQIMGLEEFAKMTQTGALNGGEDIPRKQLSAEERTAEAVEKIRNRMLEANSNSGTGP